MSVHVVLLTLIDAPVDVVFDLAVDIDLHLRSMAHSNERAIAGVTAGRIGLGETVTWRARHFGVPFTMTSRITELERPVRFVDEQLRGPFRRFRHEHRFLSTAHGTELIDIIDFDAPLGPIGWLAERVLLERYLADLIELRNRHLGAEAVAASGATGADEVLA